MKMILRKKRQGKKEGAFIDRNVEDPRAGNPCFGKRKASVGDYAVRRYLANQQILEELRKDYEVTTYDHLWSGQNKIILAGESLDFLVTNLPPDEHMARLLAQRRRMRYASFPEERGVVSREESDRSAQKVYMKSLCCIERLREHFPEMIIITYTGAQELIREACSGIGATYVLHRGRWSLDYEIAQIKGWIAGEK